MWEFKLQRWLRLPRSIRQEKLWTQNLYIPYWGCLGLQTEVEPFWIFLETCSLQGRRSRRCQLPKPHLLSGPGSHQVASNPSGKPSKMLSSSGLKQLIITAHTDWLLPQNVHLSPGLIHATALSSPVYTKRKPLGNTMTFPRTHS